MVPVISAFAKQCDRELPFGAVHKRRHQSEGKGQCHNMILLRYEAIRKSDGEGGQKSQKMDDVFNEQPL